MRKLLIIALIAGGGWYFYSQQHTAASANAAKKAMSELEDIAAKAKLKAKDIPLSERDVLPHSPDHDKIFHCKDKGGGLVISNLSCEDQGLRSLGKEHSSMGTVSHYAPAPVIADTAKHAQAPSSKMLGDSQ